jgi:hypothetical protein
MTWRALCGRLYLEGGAAVLGGGWAVQVDLMKYTLKPPGTKRLKL